MIGKSVQGSRPESSSMAVLNKSVAGQCQDGAMVMNGLSCRCRGHSTVLMNSVADQVHGAALKSSVAVICQGSVMRISSLTGQV